MQTLLPFFTFCTMPFSHLRLSVTYLPINRMPNTLLSPPFDYAVERTQFQLNTMQLNYRVSVVKNMSPPFGLISSFTVSSSFLALHTSISTGEKYDDGECCEQEVSGDSPEEQNKSEGIQLDNYSIYAESYSDKDYKESERRRKIGLANKGRMPWNKGRKHSAETRERIRQRTKEALRDPKVRKKMSECPRAHSKRTVARIRSSLRRLWGGRLKWKRSREKFLLSWAENIAEAAKKGGVDQQELDWDSYDKIKKEIALQQLQWAAEKVKAKEMAKIRAVRSAQAKAEKMARLAQKKKEQEQKEKVREEIKRKTHKKSKEEKEEFAVSQELKLKARLTKIHKKKSVNGEVTSQYHRAWEKFDLEFIDREQKQQEVSLADQIRAAKNRRAEFVAREALPVRDNRATIDSCHLLQQEI
ncbi:vicilin-like seed storage protein At2g18540 [Cornus florida]|uniref:vicilin-like seed storage protein At2g18540 n=1 Tax=Cornus florida TaxID=4283 RepID=UPI00289B42A3|nr:vicilin-like seed storage protein At2g18540 [Cornus florida]